MSLFQGETRKCWGWSYPEINGLLDDLAFKSDEAQQWMKLVWNIIKAAESASVLD